MLYTIFLHSLVLENLVHGFVRPNVLDVKLGTVLYAPDASPEKVARMERTARDTTSLETGVRLTGFQVGYISFSVMQFYCGGTFNVFTRKGLR